MTAERPGARRSRLTGAMSAAAVACFACCAGAAADAAPPDWRALDLPTIACRGCEHSGRFVEDNPGWGPHLVTLFCTGKNPDSPWHTAQQHLYWAANSMHSYVPDGEGALVVWAHPSERDFEDIVQLRGLTGIEICHGGDAGGRERLWDRVLTWCVRNGRPVLWGFAADDTHSSRNIDRSWFAARLQKPTEWELKGALQRGEFYVSNGPVIRDVEVLDSGPTVTVKLARAADVRWVKSGQYGIGPATVTSQPGENHCVKFDPNVAQSSYTLDEDDSTLKADSALFVRCIVTTQKKGEAAFTQPFVIRDNGLGLDDPYPREYAWYKGQTHNHMDAREGDEQRIRDYHAAYAAKGHACSFETGYDYWVMPFLRYPADRVPTIERVEPTRFAKGKVGKITIHGRGFPEGAKVVLSGGTLNWNDEQKDVRCLSAERIEVTLPASLGVGRYNVQVTKPYGLQDTLQYALVVQGPDACIDGWTRYGPDDANATPIGSRYTYAVAADPRGGVWVATNHGLNRFDGRKWDLFRRAGESQVLQANTLYDLQVDRDGAVWYTCFSGIGLLRPDGTNEQWPSAKIGIPNYQVNQILRAGDETYATAMNRRGLFVHKAGEWKPVALPGELARGPKLTGMARDKGGRLWIGSEGGVLCWDRAKGDAGWKLHTKANSGLPDDHVVRLVFDSKGRLWVATATKSEQPVGGLACLDSGKWRTFSPGNSPLPERRVWSVFVDSDDAIWAATSKGVACRRADGTWKVYNVLNSGLSDDLVTDICQDTDGNLWFATADGVSAFSGAGTTTRAAPEP